MIIFPTSPVFHGIQDLAKTLTSSDRIYENVVNQDLKFGHEVHPDVGSNGC